MTSDLGGIARKAAKWSLLTEAIAKLIVPLTQLMLARILAPEAFGIVATVVMVSSFAEMISDAGFQKYLVQHEFADQRSLYQAANVAFWASMTVSIGLLAVITLGRNEIAELVGSPGLGLPIAVASCSLPTAVIASTQQALFRRDFEYKKLLPIRVSVALIPLFVAVPLAFLGLSYWALIIGLLLSSLVNAVAMTIASPWKPRFFFSFSLLRKMFSFSGWTLLESISIWATIWAGTFVVGSLLSSYELGLYRQPILVINSAFALVTSATTPILFATLSRLQFDHTGFREFFLHFQFIAAVVLFPVGVGAFFYRDFFTDLLFGSQWSDASLMFGTWALTTGLNIVLSHFYSEVFRALGRPRVSFFSQCLYMAVMIPALYIAALDSFVTLVIVNASVRFVAIIINQSLAYLVAGIGLVRVAKNLYPSLIAAAVMGCASWWLSAIADGHWGWSVLGITACAIIYVGACLTFRRTRALIFSAIFALKARLFKHRQNARIPSEEASTHE